MSSIVISGNTSGSVTLDAPAIAGSTVLTLPATSGTVVTTATTTGISGSAITTGTVGVSVGGTGQTTYTNGELLIGNTTGNTLTKATLTAGTGISITNGTGSITIANTGGMTLLATIATTSGTSVNSGTVDLTSYKQVQIVLNAVSNSGGSGNLTMTDPNATTFNISGFSTTAAQGITGILNINLATGIIAGTVNNSTSTTLPSVATSGGSNVPLNGKTTFSTASTIFTFGASAGAFDAGSILIYGVS